MSTLADWTLAIFGQGCYGLRGGWGFFVARLQQVLPESITLWQRGRRPRSSSSSRSSRSWTEINGFSFELFNPFLGCLLAMVALTSHFSLSSLSSLLTRLPTKGIQPKLIFSLPHQGIFLSQGRLLHPGPDCHPSGPDLSSSRPGSVHRWRKSSTTPLSGMAKPRSHIDESVKKTRSRAE